MTDTNDRDDRAETVPEAEALYEEIGGDLCICQRADVPHWCESCQRRIQLIQEAFRRHVERQASDAQTQQIIDLVIRQIAKRHGSSKRRDFEVALLTIEYMSIRTTQVGIAEIPSSPEGLKVTGASEPSSAQARAPRAQEPDELLAALANFAPGSHDGLWGRIKAFIVQGAPTRAEGIAIARQITEWQTAIPARAYSPRSPEPRQEQP